MATNKNQHFVPRCYLRPFTANGEGVVINLYNIDRQKFIPNAPVKNQCSGNYFYGQDDVLKKPFKRLKLSMVIYYSVFANQVMFLMIRIKKYFECFGYFNTLELSMQLKEP